MRQGRTSGGGGAGQQHHQQMSQPDAHAVQQATQQEQVTSNKYWAPVLNYSRLGGTKQPQGTLEGGGASGRRNMKIPNTCTLKGAELVWKAWLTGAGKTMHGYDVFKELTSCREDTVDLDEFILYGFKFWAVSSVESSMKC
nr:unnamed protein product [Callosobruchus analis]